MFDNTRVVSVAFSSAVGAFLFGLDIGYIAPILDSPTFKRDVAHIKDWQNPEVHIQPAEVGFIVGIFSIGAIFTSSPMVSGSCLDYLGRKTSILVGAAVFMVGAFVQVLAIDMVTMCTGRFIAGCSIGLMSAVVSLYQSEIAPPSLRGALTSMYQLMITFGIVTAVMIDYMVAHDGGWRKAIAMQLLPASFLIAAMPWLPDSPRWLVAQSRDEEALEVLRKIRPSDGEARQELQEIQTEHQSASQQEMTWSELFTGRTKQLLMVGLSLQLLQQLVGMNAFMYFGPRIFQAVGYNPSRMQWATCMVNFLSTFPALFLIDKYGRRALLMWSSIGMTISCLTMGTFGYMMQSDVKSGEPIPEFVKMGIVASIFLFVVNFAYGWGPVVWVYCAEIFPLRHRARCVALCAMANWIGNFIIAQCSPFLLDRLQFLTFYVFAVFCAMSFLLAQWLPETKGVMLEHVDKLFADKFRDQADENKLKTYGSMT